DASVDSPPLRSGGADSRRAGRRGRLSGCAGEAVGTVSPLGVPELRRTADGAEDSEGVTRRQCPLLSIVDIVREQRDSPSRTAKGVANGEQRTGSSDNRLPAVVMRLQSARANPIVC